MSVSSLRVRHAVAVAMLVAPLLAACTSGAQPTTSATSAPAPGAGAPAQVDDPCAALMPRTALLVLERAGIRSDGNPRAILVPLVVPGSSKYPTEGCEVRLDKAPMEGLVVRRTRGGAAVRSLRSALRKSTDVMDRVVPGWEARWSDAASTIFAFRDDEVVIVQLAAQQPRVDRKQIVSRLTIAVLGWIMRNER